MLREHLRKGELCLFTGEPLDTSKGRSRGCPGHCCVTQGPPWAVCWFSTKLCACSRERSVCISSKAITLIKNVTCKSWPHYTLTLSQDLGLQRGREAQHEHSAKTLLFPKERKKLETQILSFGAGVRLQPCPWNIHSHTSPELEHTAAVRLTWQVTSVPLWVESPSPDTWAKVQFCKPLLMPFLLLKIESWAQLRHKGFLSQYFNKDPCAAPLRQGGMCHNAHTQ